ncbi:hypothetical protein KIPB_001405 [Kipferlia bialata]|uniref:Heat shock protein 70 family n=1 Tax=Kipferlia bialata TaxID=797122 RepID=A0A9K3GFI1_9EUKA|nr:hypothetical protein KIPB_001405 [Kipferlia bialata]|eukprot:g1405.t1
MPAPSDVHLAIGLDIGTYCSGVAVSLSTGETVEVYDSWTGQPSPYGKVPSYMTYTCSGGVYTPVKWGYGSLTDGTGRAKVPGGVSVSMFKLMLDPSGGAPPPPLPPGLTMGQVLADYLRHLKDIVQRKVARQWEDIYTLDSATWAITVPSRWSPSSNRVMRKAAVQAGLVPSPFDPRLSLLLDPEAAVLGALGAGSLVGGQTLLVVDAGGGGVDVTLCVVVEAEGGTVSLRTTASTHTDVPPKDQAEARYLQHIKKALGKGAEKALAANPRAVDNLLTQWRTKSVGVSSSDTDDELLIEIPPKLLRYLSEDMQEELEEESAIEVSLDRVQDIFHPQLVAVSAAIEATLGYLPSADRALLVGGFFRGGYQSQNMSSVHANHVREFVTLTDPGTVVVQGACQHAKDTSGLLSLVQCATLLPTETPSHSNVTTADTAPESEAETSDEETSDPYDSEDEVDVEDSPFQWLVILGKPVSLRHFGVGLGVVVLIVMCLCLKTSLEHRSALKSRGQEYMDAIDYCTSASSTISTADMAPCVLRYFESKEETYESLLRDFGKEHTWLSRMEGCIEGDETELNLHDAHIGPEGAGLLAKALQYVPDLTKLVLSSTGLGDEGAKTLSHSLQYLPCLTYLDIGQNGIGNDGALAVANRLHSLPDLTELWLDQNRIGDVGAKAVAGVIREGCLPQVAKVFIMKNALGAGGRDSLTYAAPDKAIDVRL